MIRFDHFMRAALYHPEKGYYTSRIHSVGHRGDFTTTPQLSNTLAKSIAQSFLQSGLLHLIEVGPGTGQLSAAVRQQLPFFRKKRIQQHLVEISPVLRALQKKKLPSVNHYSQIEDALDAAQGEAFIFSNELVDAFPVRIFRNERDRISELHVRKSTEQIEEVFLPTDELPHSCFFQQKIPPNQRFEIHTSYQSWLQDALAHLHRGEILTIDYGSSASELLARYPQGSLRGYFHQQRLTGRDLYQNAGHIDLTTDVCFDDLESWGLELGLTTRIKTSQAQFLQPYLNDSPQDQFISNPDGAGHAFQVLLQQKNG